MLTTGKKGRDQNICYTRYLFLIIEHLLGEAYKNENLKTIKPYHITTSTFKPLTAFKVPLISYMRKVAKLSHQPEKSLSLSSKEVNAKDTSDKSLSGTSMHPASHSKAKTNKKPKKKKILSSSDPKVSKYVRVPPPKKQVADT
ncbi:hypothetical protein Tco_0140800 [Tanacetum coccineum]